MATINASGSASALAKGTSTIQATSGSISGSTTLTVTAALVSIAVTPANPTIAKGTAQQFTATGTYSDNSTQNITSSVTWSSTSTAVATINTTGLASTLGVGSTTIQATSGSISGSTTLSVTAPVLVSIVVTPANPSIAKGATQQFTATGTYSDNSTQNLTSSVTWSSSSTAVATINAAGLATGVAGGNTTIRATLGSVSGSTGLTVASLLPAIDGNATTNGACNSPASSCTLYVPTAPPAVGETIVIAGWWAGQSLTASLSDGVNTYLTAAGPTNVPNTNIRAQVWYVVNKGAPLAFTVTLSGPSASGFDGIFLQLISITGLDQINPLDSATMKIATGTGTSLSVTSGTPAYPNEMIWGMFMAPYPGVPWTVGNGWVNVSGQEAVSVFAYQNTSSGLVLTPNVTASSSVDWIGFAIGFKAGQ